MKRVVVVGSGLAAIYFALLLDESIEVILVMGDGPDQANSYLAKGGIAISKSPADQESHIKDTIMAGSGLGNPDTIREVLVNGIHLLHDLQNRGLEFDKNPSREGGHAIARIEHISDQTGKFLVAHLWKQLIRRRNLILLENWHAIQLIRTEKSQGTGVLICNPDKGNSEIVFGSAIILATGGCGNLYERQTNAEGAKGEGLGMAAEAGVRTRHMEFIQFHPTKMYSSNPARNVLVTEAFRGAGAVLVDDMGVDFMKNIHLMGSLAPRDIVSLGMFKKMESNGLDYVYLDYSKVDQQVLEEKFPYLFQEMEAEKISNERIVRVTPAAHYQCGGIQVNSYAESSVNGLFALGEVASTGLHGANRLASNSLLELLHYGNKLANQFNASLEPCTLKNLPMPKMKVEKPAQLKDLEQELKGIMWHCFGILRDKANMEKGMRGLQKIEDWVQSESMENFWIARFANSLRCAKLIAKSAMERPYSLGCHQVNDGL